MASPGGGWKCLHATQINPLVWLKFHVYLNNEDTKLANCGV